MRAAPLALAAVALMAAALLPLPATAQGTGFVNIVSARSLGCSPDSWTSPDLRVTVLVDGQPAIVTEKAQDDAAPVYAQLASMPRPSSPVQVTIQVEEAEPGGFFGLGTSWLPCDTDPGAGSTYTFQWDGSLRMVAARGDASNAAEAVVVFGPDAPVAPQVRTAGVQPTSATLAWDDSGHGHRVAWGFVGDIIATVPAGGSSYVLPGLCENTEYTVRVIRDADPWHVGSPDFTFRTANEAPKAPRVLRGTADNGSTALRVELPTTHDLKLLEVFGGPDSSVAASGTPVHSDGWGHWFGTWEPTFSGTPAWVRVRATDSGGLSAVSQPFQVGGPEQSPNLLTESCPGRWEGPGSTTGTTEDPGAGSDTGSTSTDSSSTATEDSGFVADPSDAGGSGQQASDSDEDGSSLSIPLNGWTLTAAVAIALLLGAVIGLSLRRR